ncbi:MAG TPA: 50S ribosomal protein L22 [Lentisphaeria bacterium]|nr:MAG: 50S ribosomal protein L22 [Lentisphaerae bacterium GWF2_49_21]HBC85510.1 50S ribosomal protein L22 [Lentisphaeria bacterium]
MEIHAVTKYARVSPSKGSDVIHLLRGKPAVQALTMLELIPKKSAAILAKTLRSAIANAENNLDVKRENLYVKTAIIGPGPMFRRFRAKARGMAGRIRKRTSHFTIVLTDEKKQG